MTPALLTSMCTGPERGADGIRRVPDGVAVLHVGDAGDRSTAGGRDLVRQSLDALGAARQQPYRGALGCQYPRRCFADATGCTGDDRRTSRKVLCPRRPPRLASGTP
jgi:hypothetical protein